MATLEELVIKIEADNAQLRAAMIDSQKIVADSAQKMQSAISDFAKEGQKDTNKFGKTLEVFAGATLAGLALKAVDAVSGAVGALGAKFSQGVAEAASYDQSIVRLGNSLALSGNYTREAVTDLEGYIATMEELTGVDDEVIAGQLSLLSSLTRLDAEGLKRAQSAAVDLAAATGKDLDTAIRAVAMSANGNTTALQKMGVQVEKGATDAQTLANVLGVVEQRFGGSAQAQIGTYAAALGRVDTAVGNLFQEIGSIISSNPVFAASLSEVANIIKSLTGAVDGVVPSIQRGLAFSFLVVAESIEITVRAVDSFIKLVRAGFDAIVISVAAVSDSFNYLKNLITGTEDVDPFATTNAAVEQLQDNLTNTSTLGSVAEAFDRIGQAGAGAYDKIGQSTLKTEAEMQKMKSTATELSLIEKARLQQAATFAQSQVDAALNTSTAYDLQAQALESLYANDLMNFETYRDIKMKAQEEMQALELEQLNLALQNKQVTQEQFNLAETAALQRHAVEKMKLDDMMRQKEEQRNTERLKGYSTFFGGLSALTASSTKEIANIGKAAAISQATIDAYLAIQNALATVPYPANIAAAAGIGVQAFANVSKIAGIGLRSGIDSVPGVGTQDNFPAILAPGERVVPSKTNEDLTEFLRNQQMNQQSEMNLTVNFYGPVWGNKAEAGAEIVEAIREAQDRGMALRLRTT